MIAAARHQCPDIVTSANEVTPAQLVALAKKVGAKSIAYTYTEASVYYEYMLETAKIARNEALVHEQVLFCGCHGHLARAFSHWRDASGTQF